MEEKRLKMALERESKNLEALRAAKEACGDRGAKIHYNWLIKEKEAVVEALALALAYVRGDKKEE